MPFWLPQRLELEAEIRQSKSSCVEPSEKFKFHACDPVTVTDGQGPGFYRPFRKFIFMSSML